MKPPPEKRRFIPHHQVPIAKIRRSPHRPNTWIVVWDHDSMWSCGEWVRPPSELHCTDIQTGEPSHLFMQHHRTEGDFLTTSLYELTAVQQFCLLGNECAQRSDGSSTNSLSPLIPLFILTHHLSLMPPCQGSPNTSIRPCWTQHPVLHFGAARRQVEGSASRLCVGS